VYAVALGLAAALLFGASTPAAKALLGSLPPLQLAGLLYLGAALAMAPVVARERRRGGVWRLDRANAARLGGAVLFGGVLGPLLLLLGLRVGNAASVSLLLNLEMAATAVLGALWFREHLGRGGWLGAAGVAMAGALLAGAGGRPGVISALLVAGACLCWALDNHWTALVDGITPAVATLVKGTVAGAFNLALGVVASVGSATPGDVAAALGVGALGYGASIALYVASAQQLGATRAQALFACAPFAGAALSAAFLGDRFGAAEAAAALLLLASVIALLRSRHAHLHAHAALEHVHAHRHDDGHHLHAHPGSPASTRHTHPHRHEPLVHAHPHWPDLHHRHDH
jgi:drug/metabolite transporter (DMT)-like permease